MRDYTKSFSDAFEDFQKAIRNRSHLVPKQIVDKNGVSRTVMVRPDKDMPKQKTPVANRKDLSVIIDNFIAGEKLPENISFNKLKDLKEKAVSDVRYKPDKYIHNLTSEDIKTRDALREFASQCEDRMNEIRRKNYQKRQESKAQKKYDDDKAFEEYKKLVSKDNLTNEESSRVGELVLEHFKHSDKTWPGGAALKQKL